MSLLTWVAIGIGVFVVLFILRRISSVSMVGPTKVFRRRGRGPARSETHGEPYQTAAPSMRDASRQTEWQDSLGPIPVNESFPSHPAQKPISPEPISPTTGVIDPNVQFTVYRPRTIVPLKWYSVLAFAHLSKLRPDASADEPDPVREVQLVAAKLLSSQPASYDPAKLDKGFSVPQKGLLKFVPFIEGCEFNPREQSIHWEKSVHKLEFEIKASASVDGKDVEGQMTVFLGRMILTEVPLRISVDSHFVHPETQPLPLAESSAGTYRQIFASYSYKDTNIVEDFENHIAALGDRYLRDVKDLRSGEVWSTELERLIRNANVFQLFWSSNSMSSKFVRQEWEYALGLNRPKFIRPVYWEVPLPETQPDLPPEALRRLHFHRFVRDTEEERGALLPPMTGPHGPGEPPSSGSSGIESHEDSWSTARQQRRNLDPVFDDLDTHLSQTEYSPRQTAAVEQSEPWSFPAHPSPSAAIPHPSRKAAMPMALGIFLAGLVLLAGLAYLGYRIWLAPGPPQIPVHHESPTPTATATPTASPTATARPSPSPTLTPKSSPTQSPDQTFTPKQPLPSGPTDIMVSVDPTLHLKEPGDTSTYYLVVRNDTKGVITNLEIREHLPADLEFVSSKPQPIKQDSHNIVWQALKLGTSSADDYFVPTVTVRLLRSLKPGESLTSEQTVTYVDAQGNQRINRSVVIPVKVRAKRGEDLER